MEKKYRTYLNLLKSKEQTVRKELVNKELNNNSNSGIESELQNGFLTKNDIELIFPGHINSYYASAEF